MTTGEKITKLRKDSGYSQEAFSEKLDISRQTVSRWENGTAQPSGENLVQIAQLFDIPLSSLLDDDIYEADGTSNSEIYEQLPEISQKKKAFSGNRVLALFFIIVIFAQTLIIADMKNQVDSLRGEVNMVQTRLDSLSGVLGLYRNNTDKQPDTASFTDYSWQVLSYNYETGVATVKINVLPLDYSRSTAVRFALKTETGMQMVDATFEDHTFTATADIQCADRLPLYMYLTDGDKVRSYLVDYLPDFSSDYKLKIRLPRITGHYTLSAEDGVLDVNNTTFYFMTDYKISSNADESVYPEIAVVQTLCDGKVIHETAVDKVTETDYNLLAQSDPSYEPDGIFWGRHDVHQRICEYGDSKISDSSVKSDSRISFRLIVKDNHGVIYEIDPVIVD